MRRETALSGTLVLFYGTLFPSAIFCTGHNGAEMCRISCSLRIILLKPRKWEKYRRRLAFLKFLQFITPSFFFFFFNFFPNHERRLNSTALFPSTVQRKKGDFIIHIFCPEMSVCGVTVEFLKVPALYQTLLWPIHH